MDVASSLKGRLCGEWRLIFTTGTIDTQKKLKAKINYFPLKAVQTFAEGGEISNSIYFGDFNALKFSGTYQVDCANNGIARVEFDFDELRLL